MEREPEQFEVSLAESERFGDPVIWRYMAIHKFQDLLTRKSLFFPTKQLFSDFLEGSFDGDHDVVAGDAARSVAPPPPGRGPHINDEDDGLVWNRTILQHPVRQAIQAQQATHQHLGISCWTKRDAESVALWGLYTGRESGIAIRSRLSLMRVAVDGEDLSNIHVGQVRYVDKRPAGLAWNPYRSLLYKSVWYEYERELRFMKIFSTETAQARGCSVSVRLEDLIEAVVLHPMTGDQFRHQIETCVAAAGLSPSLVKKSAIAGTASRL